MSSKPAAPAQMNALPYVARHVLQCIGKHTQQRVSVRKISLEFEDKHDLRTALNTLTHLCLIEHDQRSLRLTSAGLACIGIPAHATQPAKTSAAIDLARKSMPSTTASWGTTRPAPICNASVKELYRGNQMGASGRMGAQDFLRIASLCNAKASTNVQ